MQLLRWGVWLGAALFWFSCAWGSEATPIGPNCGTCQGSIYDVTYDPTPVVTTATSETWRITYTIDTSGYNGVGVYLNNVAVKVSSSILDANLIAAPGGVASWVELSGGLNAAGCSGSGSGYDCASWATYLVLAPAVPGGLYAWVFDIELPTGNLFVGTDEASVKARYVKDNGTKAGALVSENITLSQVPEPGTAVLLSAAAAKLRAYRRRDLPRLA